MTGKFSALMKTANPQIQEAQQIPRRVNIKETTPSGQRKKDTCIDLQTRMSADFSSEIERIKRQRETFLKCFKKTLSTYSSLPRKIPFRNRSAIKILNKIMLRTFVANRPAQ